MKSSLASTNPQWEALREILQQGHSVTMEELWNSPKALVAAFTAETTKKHVVLVTGASPEENQLYHDFPFFTETPILDFPAWETLPGEEISPSPDIVGERYKVLETLRKSQEPHIILTGIQACLQKVILPSTFSSLYLELDVGTEYSFDGLITALEKMHYTRSSVAADKGEYAVRGGIIDLFPVNSPDPFRIEFFGDTVESIRIYDPIGQKSIKNVDKAEVVPAQEAELLPEQQQLGTLLDYLGENVLIILDDVLAIEDRYATLKGMLTKAGRTFCSLEEWLERMASLQTLFWTEQPLEDLSTVEVLSSKETRVYSQEITHYPIRFSLFSHSYEVMRWKPPFIPIRYYLLPDAPPDQPVRGDELLLALPRLQQKACQLHVLCENDWEEENFRKQIEEKEISLPSMTTFHRGYLSSGLVVQPDGQILFPTTEVTHRHKIRRQKLRSTYHTPPSEIFALAPGDPVVHLNNGIGIYRGMEQRPNHEGELRDFMVVEYADKAKLYVPLNQAYLISRYIGATEEVPKLHAMGSSRWKRTKERTENAIMAYASDLLELYAKRSQQSGFPYPSDSPELAHFEKSFPFVETEDQIDAIKAIKDDMTSTKTMDRLVCGDVGYGKTEVAMRAAFKTVLDGGKQVAILVPTTVLAMQHYETFLERMQEFPIGIEVLSRFRTTKQIRHALDGCEKGSVDILIGTHRIISPDVRFKDLGLVVIDEEQRFGVKAKERLKKLKTEVDCLTLSATPIPRTLYMSLVGARDMSVINTPPQDRQPIKTIISEAKSDILKNALLRELSRDGQVYIIHNRVETIYERAHQIQKLVPHARIVVGHGQMHADEVDTVFHTFKTGRADILVATTIVENGIDIPNANTIFIDNAEHFGMADLYQLRGRVGRWNRRAYAYFLIRSWRTLPEISRKRLQALAESSGYGGGMRVAMRDLELRGAGNILGHEQSGHVTAIGFHLYCKLLKRTVRALQGDISAALIDTRIDLPIDARLSYEYVNATSLQMEIYQRLGEAVNEEEVDAIFAEINDRFGPPPECAQWLYYLTKLRVYCASHAIPLVKYEKGMLLIEKRHKKKTEQKKIPYPKLEKPEDIENILLPLLIQ